MAQTVVVGFSIHFSFFSLIPCHLFIFSLDLLHFVPVVAVSVHPSFIFLPLDAPGSKYACIQINCESLKRLTCADEQHYTFVGQILYGDSRIAELH